MKDSASLQEIAQIFAVECGSTTNIQAELRKREFEWRNSPVAEIELMEQGRDEALRYSTKIEQRLEEEIKARNEAEARAQQEQ